MPLALGAGGAAVLLAATASWLQVLAALAMLRGLALALPRLVARQRPGPDA